MSYTQIYTVSDSHCEQIGETKNAFRSAMYVWDHIAVKYFGLECFPHFDDKLQRRVWNANNEHSLTDAERIVLASTMDYVTVTAEDVQRLVAAFKEFGAEHPLSSIREQAEIISSAEIKPGQRISWCQTTIGEFQFAPEWNEEDDTYEYSDLSSSWDLFEQFDLISSSK